MKSFYCYPASLNSHKSNILVCFYTGRNICIETFFSEITSHFENLIFTKDIVFITHDFNKKIIREKLLNEQVQISLKDSINSLQELYFHTCFIDLNGKFEIESYNQGGLSLNNSDLENIVEIGLVDVINKRDLVVNASSNTHFVKPSGKHTSKFIDVKNILESSNEISFIATSLLKFLPKNIERLYVDTPGIYPLAFELVNLIKCFDESKTEILIDSFSSYGGVDDYKFSTGHNTLILISASTSNELYENLKKHPRLHQAEFITLIMTEKKSESQKVLVEFEQYRAKYKEPCFDKFSSYPENDCPICSGEASIPLQLDKSRFHVSPPRTELYLPLARDSTNALRSLITKYKNTKAFKCLYDGVDGKKIPTPEYFIDVGSLIQNDDFKNKILNRFINRRFPLNTDCIVHCNDSGAEELANFVKEEAVKKGLTGISIQNATAFNPDNVNKGIIVVAASLESGKALLNVSRELRVVSHLPVTYLIGFAKYNSKNEFEKLKQDLTYSKGPSGMHTFYAVDEILLPINEMKKTSWDKEIDLLNKISPQYESTPILKDTIEERISYLKSCRSTEVKGLGDSLFIKTNNDSELHLGKNFAFWDEADTGNVWEHQATVYFTISSILQNLRKGTKNGKNPLGEGYIIRQLDPLLFDRFNEGIIQASLLRCAKPMELDYRRDAHNSNIVGSLIERMLKNPDSPESSGLTEFLLALCLKTLQIDKKQLQNFCFNEHLLDQNKHSMAWILLQQLQKPPVATSDEVDVPL